MDLSQQSLENVEYMIDEIKTKLRMASGAALLATQFDLNRYEDLKDVYDHVKSKTNVSVSEMDAIVMELGKLRKV